LRPLPLQLPPLDEALRAESVSAMQHDLNVRVCVAHGCTEIDLQMLTANATRFVSFHERSVDACKRSAGESGEQATQRVEQEQAPAPAAAKKIPK
jgi:hypothetical protein